MITAPAPTDMSAFEDALNEDWCHLVDRPCGHVASPNRHLHVRNVVGGWCVACRRRVCPDCGRIEAL